RRACDPRGIGCRMPGADGRACGRHGRRRAGANDGLRPGRRAADRPRRHGIPEPGVYSTERQWQRSGCCRWCGPESRSARDRTFCRPSAARTRGGRTRTPRATLMTSTPELKHEKPLTGWRVLVPRGGPWGDGVAASLRAQGAVPVVAPLINFGPTTDQPALDDALEKLAAGGFDWLTI